jgi:hypothetical protein
VTRALGILAAAAVLIAALAGAAAADEGWSVKGWVGVGSLSYYNQRDLGLINDGAFVETEADIVYDFDESFRLRLRPFIAIDMLQESRNRFLALDGYVEYRSPRWALLAGQMVESWAVTDVFSPIDVLNRRDIGFDLYNPPKLGELATGRLRLFLPDVGPVEQPSLAVYFLPVLQTVPLPANDDRFAFDLTGDGRGDLASGSIAPKVQVAYAARLAATVAGVDLSMVYFGGPARLPSFANVSPLGIITPTYYRVDLIGGGAQWALGPWMLRGEVAYTSTRNPGLSSRLASVVPPSYFQFVVGIERTFADLFGKNELTVGVGYSGEDHTGPTTLAAFRPLRSDVLINARWAFHDRRRTEINATAAVDVIVNEQLWRIELQTQLLERLKLLLGGQFVNRAPRSGGVTVFNFFPNNSNVRAALRFEF